MDGWIYEKIDSIERALSYLVQEVEAAKKKAGKPEEKKWKANLKEMVLVKAAEQIVEEEDVLLPGKGEKL